MAYVGNIAFEAGEEDLREIMSDCTITKVRLHTDRETGRFKGYAHVHFADEQSLDRWASWRLTQYITFAARFLCLQICYSGTCPITGLTLPCRKHLQKQSVCLHEVCQGLCYLDTNHDACIAEPLDTMGHLSRGAA